MYHLLTMLSLTRFGFKWSLLLLTAVLALTVACSALPDPEVVGYVARVLSVEGQTPGIEVECTVRNNGATCSVAMPSGWGLNPQYPQHSMRIQNSLGRYTTFAAQTAVGQHI